MKHILTALAFMLILPYDTLAQTMPDHTAYPPFLCQSTPSVLLILDNSKSMLLPAYGNYYESDPDAPIRGDQEKFKEDEPYSGYFDPAAKYFYDTTLNLFTKDNNGNTADWMQGNLLNWITMRRIDIARKVLVGGKVNTRSGGGQRILIGEKDTPDYPGAAFIKSYENQAKTLDLWFGVKGGSLYVVNKTGVINKEEVFTKGDIYKIEVTAADDPGNYYDDQGNPLGIIQRMGDKVRFGLELFNVQAVDTVCSDEAHACKNHDRHGKTGDECTNSGRGIEHRSEKGEWADTWRCTVSDGGKIVVPVDFGDETYTDGAGNKTTHIDDIVTWIEFGKSVVRDYEGNSREKRRQVSNSRGGKRRRQKPGEPSGWAWSPLAEAFREGVRYFRQEKPVYYPDDFEVNKSWDPYYYDDETGYVPCCNSFIVFITDGQSTDDREAGFKDNDTDGNDPGSDDDYPGNIQERQGSDWLDDIALWAHANDLRKEDGFKGSQNIILFPIFLNFSQEDDDEQRAVQLLKDAAENGGGAYLEANDGEELEKALLRSIHDTLRQIKTASGTSLVVVGNSGGGGGTAFHAYFRPSKIIDKKEVNWLGYLQALWVDPYGNLREDNGDKRLDLEKDEIIEFSFNKDAKETEIKRYGVDVDEYGNPANDSPTIASLDDISPIWEAGKTLAGMNISVRNIQTYIKGTTGFTEFKEGNASTLKPYLRAADDAEAENIINFIRGEDAAGLRDRTVDDAGTVWRLGDIIYSTPAVVRRPMARYIYRYGDTSYYDFLEKYHERETVVYVGANDGMLHAFRAGVHHEGDDPGTEDTREYGWYEGDKIGEELWAYIPYNLLPHLKWLSDPNYTHVYYVDLKPRVIDASIFKAGGDHPGGWGTVLIGGMRFGGKGVKIDDFNGSGAPKTFSSAYFALDITNPANPPKLLWEFTNPELGFTTSYRGVAKVKGKWFVIAGSGPTDYDGTSDQTAGIFVLDLKTGDIQHRFKLSDNAFMADPVCVDIDLKVDSGYGTEVCYIGMIYR
ncbi:MAG: pilus assembly protein, partial [Nitrospinota bacterium]